jgi:succinoglycan biosynthesis protein ExoV
MKLHFYKDPNGNFGDDINPWLWPKIMPEIFDEIENELFVGIGTLINYRLPKEPVKHIFGSGVGYGPLPEIDNSYVIHSVRGFKSAELLNLNRDIVITDPAILVRTVSHPRAEKKIFPAGFMPHGDSLKNFDWEAFCNDIGLHFISSRWNVDRVLYEISQCEVLLAEAKHGAIVADALRIPWLPLNCYGNTLTFKWQDWLSTIDIDYCPRKTTPLYSLPKDITVTDLIKIRTKQVLHIFGMTLPTWTPPPPLDSKSSLCDEAKNQIYRIAQETPFLSNENTLSIHTDRYSNLIEKFRIRAKPM